MSHTVELRIRNELLQGRQPVEIIEELFQNFSSSTEDLLSVFHFAVQSGAHRTALNFLLKRIRERDFIAWAHLVEILAQHSVKPKPALLDALFEGIAEQDASSLVDRTRKWDGLDQRFAQIHSEEREKHQSLYQERIQSLRDKLQFLKAQRIVTEEEKLLNQLLDLFPEDQDLLQHQEEFKERWARDIINRSSSGLEPEWETSVSQLDEGEMLFLSILEGALQEQLQNKPEYAYDFALMLYCMGDFEGSLKMIEQTSRNEGIDWFEVDVLLEARHFVAALDKIASLDAKYADNPETTFSCAYTRAQALYGLGQVSSALELVRSIVSVRPHYRSAHSLLTVWSSQGQ